MNRQISRFPCPCCGHMVHSDPPGSHRVCAICFWEDDVVQLRWPSYSGGANKASLLAAQANYVKHGASDLRFRESVRQPSQDEPFDTGFRPADPEIDNFEAEGGKDAPWPADRTVLYWWRATYWRARS
ncbi:MAG TPA: CPCC family cysteine-rich protein [Actinophytocola sp.]|uniref:CPCC family cysteine-rich protein n=1 Tax=Actinophytocola sp. TaxID=1872138 RepID=UPI002DBF66EB|nr:CPCC family cysteine-rich protein [Actinophytocola sp.]HEU5470688.1 CPCC family cysteine-rich protein [Actinophytocola sp.]